MAKTQKITKQTNVNENNLLAVKVFVITKHVNVTSLISTTILRGSGEGVTPAARQTEVQSTSHSPKDDQ